MTGKTHQILGITAGVGYYLAVAMPEYNPATFGAVVLGSHLVSLIPDIDQPAAEIWDSLPFGHIAGKIADPFLKHRNITHSLLGFGIISLALYFLISKFPDYWGINHSILLFSSMIAYGSHLVADLFTEEGIPLLFPYKRMFGIPPKPFEHVRITTGSWFENLVIFPAINFFLIVLIVSKWSEIKSIIFK